MSPSLRAKKLHVTFNPGSRLESPRLPRCYTLTHSDRTGNLYLTVGPEVNRRQISGLYTRLMRDEVVAAWQAEPEQPGLHVHLHVSGGIVFGSAAWRDSIFRHHLEQVLQAFRYGDRDYFAAFPELDRAPIIVHFHASQPEIDRTEEWGQPADYWIGVD